VKSIVNKMLRRFGCEVRRIGPSHGPEAFTKGHFLEKYREQVNELHGCLNELLFPQLPACPGRQELLAKLIGTPVSEAMYIIAHLHRSMAVDGDVCEFGIAQGATSALLANEIRATDKQLWLFDSFQGLPQPTEKDVLINDIFGLGSIENYAGKMAEPRERVLSRLQSIDFPAGRTRIVAGFVEETIKTAVMPDRVCFAYVDFDFYEPILTALRFLRRHLSVGGTVIVDDYGFFSAGAKTAVDEFMAESGTQFEMTLPRKFAAASTPFCVLSRLAADASREPGNMPG
jgi:hypothetical protein